MISRFYACVFFVAVLLLCECTCYDSLRRISLVFQGQKYALNTNNQYPTRSTSNSASCRFGSCTGSVFKINRLHRIQLKHDPGKWLVKKNNAKPQLKHEPGKWLAIENDTVLTVLDHTNNHDHYNNAVQNTKSNYKSRINCSLMPRLTFQKHNKDSHTNRSKSTNKSKIIISSPIPLSSSQNQDKYSHTNRCKSKNKSKIIISSPIPLSSSQNQDKNSHTNRIKSKNKSNIINSSLISLSSSQNQDKDTHTNRSKSTTKSKIIISSPISLLSSQGQQIVYRNKVITTTTTTTTSTTAGNNNYFITPTLKFYMNSFYLPSNFYYY